MSISDLLPFIMIEADNSTDRSQPASDYVADRINSIHCAFSGAYEASKRFSGTEYDLMASEAYYHALHLLAFFGISDDKASPNFLNGLINISEIVAKYHSQTSKAYEAFLQDDQSTFLHELFALTTGIEQIAERRDFDLDFVIKDKIGNKRVRIVD